MSAAAASSTTHALASSSAAAASSSRAVTSAAAASSSAAPTSAAAVASSIAAGTSSSVAVVQLSSSAPAVLAVASSSSAVPLASSSTVSRASASLGAASAIPSTPSAQGTAASTTSLSAGAIGGIVGGVVGALALAFLVWTLWKWILGRRYRRDFPLPPPRSMSNGPGTATLTAARRASMYTRQMATSPASPQMGYFATSPVQQYSSHFSSHPSLSHPPSSESLPPLLGGRSASSSTNSGVEPSPTGTSPSDSPEIRPADDLMVASLPVNLSVGLEPSLSASSPPGSTSSHSSGSQQQHCVVPPHQPLRPSPLVINTHSQHHQHSSHHQRRASRQSIPSLSTSRSFNGRDHPALRSGVPHAGRGVHLQMPTPLAGGFGAISHSQTSPMLSPGAPRSSRPGAGNAGGHEWGVETGDDHGLFRSPRDSSRSSRGHSQHSSIRE